MSDIKPAEQVTYIINQMLEPFGRSIPAPTFGLFGTPGPFDLSKPNEHNNKAEFIREKETVEASLEGLEVVIGSLIGAKEDPHRDEIAARLKSVLNAKFRSGAPMTDLRDSYRLIKKNVADVGGYAASIFIMLDLQSALRLRLDELRDQEKKFWDVSHRPPDYHARAIALRLAQLFVRETGQKPTFGTSGETGDASTGYARALRDIYKVLGIGADLRGPATWAIDKIRTEDLRPPEHAAVLNALAPLFSQPLEDPELAKYRGPLSVPPSAPIPAPLPIKPPR